MNCENMKFHFSDNQFQAKFEIKIFFIDLKIGKIPKENYFKKKSSFRHVVESCLNEDIESFFLFPGKSVIN